jgi:predicted nucleotidyltransferase
MGNATVGPDRDALLARAVDVFEGEGASAIHLFGSLARGDHDPLSDIDLWLTVPDAGIGAMIERRFEIFSDVAEAVIHHEAPRNRPLGGAYTLVIHRVRGALVQVDYYLAPETTSVVLPEARRLAGQHPLPRGQWILDATASASESVPERIDFLTCMSFIGVKKALRGDRAFLSFLAREYERFRLSRVEAGERLERTGELDDPSPILQALRHMANERQTAAIDAVLVDISRQVELMRRCQPRST